MPYYFVRVNGNTLHNDPNTNCYIVGEPPNYPNKKFNYYRYCLEKSIIRIGWPDVGDLLIGNRANALSNCYDLNSIQTRHRNYLFAFSQIPQGSVILMPNIEIPGELYLGEVTKTYWYHYNIPIDPYECSHRISVNWDCKKDRDPVKYNSKQFGINHHIGWWRFAFYKIQNGNIIKAIDRVRQANGF